jgi:hypothetical protein
MVVFATRSKASNTLAGPLLRSGGVGLLLFDRPVLDSEPEAGFLLESLTVFTHIMC